MTPHRPALPTPPMQPGAPDAAVRLILPVGRSGWAIAAGYAGVASVLVVPAPLAVVLGILAIIDIRRHPHKRGMGRAIFGLVMGALFSSFLSVLLAAMTGGGELP